MQETVAGYWYAPYGVKPNQGVGRLLETLVCAMEYFKLPTTAVSAASQPQPWKATWMECGAATAAGACLCCFSPHATEGREVGVVP